MPKTEVIERRELGYLQHFTNRGDVENILTLAIENIIQAFKDDVKGKDNVIYVQFRYERLIEIMLKNQESTVTKEIMEKLLTFLVCKEYLRFYDWTETRGYCLFYPDFYKLNWTRSLTRLPSYPNNGWIPITDYMRSRNIELKIVKALIIQGYIETVTIDAVRYVNELYPEKIKIS